MPEVRKQRIGIIMNGVTGRMGSNQHLMRSIVPIMRQGGVETSDSRTIMPDPILVGRNPDKLKRVSGNSGVEKWTTDLDAVLGDADFPLYFDSTSTHLRVTNVTKAIEAGKHVYCEKPTALTCEDALKLYRLADETGVKNGVVQDKLFLPGMLKLNDLRNEGFFGRILSVRGEFGYWVFEGDVVPAQRPSWNYRKDDGGSILIDMFCHWRYVLDNLFGAVRSVCCLGATHIPKRWDENGKQYDATADDAAYVILELDGGVIVQINSSWCVRVRRDDLLTLQVDGTQGSAVAGLRKVWIQPYDATPKPVWNPDVDQPVNFYDDWREVPDKRPYDNAFKVQWEMFLRHVAADEPFRWNLLQGAKGVQLAQAGQDSWRQKRWVELEELK